MSSESDLKSSERSLEATEDIQSSVAYVAVERPPLEKVDGGLQAWSTLAGAFIVVFCSSGYVNSFGVYEDYYVRIYLSNHSSSTINWIAGAQTFCLFSMGIFSGYAMDIGYFRHVMWSGSLLFVVCLFMISISQPQQWYQLFLAQGVGLGIAIGSVYVPSLGVVTHHFKKRRSLAMGIVASGSSLGGVVHPIMLNQLFHSRIGFHWGVRISAFFNLGLFIIANLMMSTRLPPQQKKLTDLMSYWGAFLRDKSYIAATAGTFLLILGVFFPTLFLQLDSIKHGINVNLAFYTIAILNGSSAFGRVLPTIIADRTGVFTLLVPSTLACGIINFSVIAVKNAAGAIIVAILYGFFSGAAISLLGPMLANISTNMSEVGARIGLCFGIGGIGSLIGILGYINSYFPVADFCNQGPPITGALLSSKLIWLRPALFNGICMVLSAVILVAAGVISSRAKLARTTN